MNYIEDIPEDSMVLVHRDTLESLLNDVQCGWVHSAEAQIRLLLQVLEQNKGDQVNE